MSSFSKCFFGWVLFCLTAVPVFSQEIDFVEVQRLNNPPDFADYIEISDEPYVERWDYTANFDFNGNSVVKIDRIEGETEPTDTFNTNFLSFDDDSFLVAGVFLALEVAGNPLPAELVFDPMVELPRFYSVGDQIERTGTTTVQLGLFPVEVNFLISYDFQAIESVETPLGNFDNVVRVSSVKTASASIPLIGELEDSLVTMEWYHPSVGLVQAQDLETNEMIQLQTIEPPLTVIDDWSLYDL